MESILETLERFLLDQGFDRLYWIAYSGGVDSHVLLNALSLLRKKYPLKLHAVYINHGWSLQAENWRLHCSEVCRALNIEFSAHSITVSEKNPEDSPEENARNARYAIFEKLLNQQDMLLTAHHQDDQAETVLLQLLRGSGPKGLAAMPVIKSFGKGYLARPFLTVARSAIENYANHYQLKWVEDESNANLNFTRNFLRQEILTLLKKKWPTVNDVLSRVAENCAEAQILLDEMAANDLQDCYCAKPVIARSAFCDEAIFLEIASSQKALLAMTGVGESSITKPISVISIKKLKQFSPERQRNILRYWLRQLNFSVPSSIKLQQIQQDMLHAREDKLPYFVWDNVELRRFQDELYALPFLENKPDTLELSWDMKQPLQLPRNTLHTILTKGKGLRTDLQDISVRFRQGGEKIQLAGRSITHSLKKLFQDWNVPTWERNWVPLIYVGDQLAVVVGYAIAEGFQARENELGVTVIASRR